MLGFVEIEYGVRMVGDCIRENGEERVGVTLIAGITRAFGGLAEADEAAAAAAPDDGLRFFLPSNPLAAG